MRFVVKCFSGDGCSSDLGGVSIAIALSGCGGLGHVEGARLISGVREGGWVAVPRLSVDRRLR